MLGLAGAISCIVQELMFHHTRSTLPTPLPCIVLMRDALCHR